MDDNSILLRSKQSIELMNKMNSNSFENSFWSPNYKNGFNKLINLLNDESLKFLNDFYKFFQFKYDCENSYCDFIHNQSLLKRNEILKENEGGGVTSCFESSLLLVNEIDNESKIRKGYSILLNNEILLPLNDFRVSYKSQLKTEFEKVNKLIEEYESIKRKFNSIKSEYRSKFRVLNTYSDLKIKESLKLFESLNEKRIKKLFENEPLIYTISSGIIELKFDRDEFISILNFLTTNSKLIEYDDEDSYSKFFKLKKKRSMDANRRISNGCEITKHLIDSIDAIDSVQKAEIFGQFLIDNSFLNNVSINENKFANINEWEFEWLLKSFDLCNLEPPFEISINQIKESEEISPSSTSTSSSLEASSLRSFETSNPPAFPTLLKKLTSESLKLKLITSTTEETNDTADEEFLTIKNLKLECDELENRYLNLSIKLDDSQSNLELSIFNSMQRLNCLEFERSLCLKSFLNRYIELTFKNNIEIGNYRFYNNTTAFMDDDSNKVYNSLIELKDSINNMNPIADLCLFVENNKTGSYLSKVEVFEPLKGKKITQLFGTNLASLIKLENRPIPCLVLELLTKINDLISADFKHHKWWIKTPIIDYKTCFKIRSNLNNLVRTDYKFFNPIDGVMTKETRRALSANIKNLVNDELSDDLISQNLKDHQLFVECDDKSVKEIRLFTLFELLKVFFLQLPESLIPSKFVPKLNSIYSKDSTTVGSITTSDVLFNEVIKRLGDNIFTLNAIVLLWEMIIDSCLKSENYGEDNNNDVELIYQFISKFFIESIIHNNSNTNSNDDLKFNDLYSIKLVKDLFILKINLEFDIQTKNDERKLNKRKQQSQKKKLSVTESLNSDQQSSSSTVNSLNNDIGFNPNLI